jgi:hypothetical protein
MTPTWGDYCSDKIVAGEFENRILYAMCRDNPSHDCAYINAGKVMAIGRIYAASPERGAGKPKEPGTPLVECLGQRLSGSTIDDMINNIEFNDLFSEKIIASVIDAHNYLVEEVVSATCGWSSFSNNEDWKPREQASFASKYLHVHRPNAFPIMDFFARAGLKCLGQPGSFDAYKSFCEALLKHTKTLNGDWTPRSLDRTLVKRGRIHQDRSATNCQKCNFKYLKRSHTKQGGSVFYHDGKP